MSLFKKNKNRNKVKSRHYLLGLLQQTMTISSADHRDLSLVCQAQASLGTSSSSSSSRSMSVR